MTKYAHGLILLLLFVFATNIALAVEVLVGPVNQTLTTTNPRLNTTDFNATGYSNLVLSFTFDSRELDGPQGGSDYFVYGWRSAGVDNQLGRIDGLSGAAAAEQGEVTMILPAEAEVDGLIIYIEMFANSANDDVKITNLRLEGDRKVMVPTTSELTIVKEVSGTTTTDWAFTFVPNGTLAKFSLNDTNPSQLWSDLEPGTYTMTELVPDGWQLTSVNCGDWPSQVDLSAGAVTLELAAGDSATCVFNNSPVRTPVVIKLPIPATLCVETEDGMGVAGIQTELTSASGTETGLTDDSGCVKLEIDAFSGPWTAGFVADAAYDLVSVNTTSDLSGVVSSTVPTWWSEACRLVFPIYGNDELLSPTPGTPMVLPNEFNCTAVLSPATISTPVPPTTIRSSSRGGGGSRNVEPELVVEEILSSPEPLILGELVSVVPVGGVAAGVRPTKEAGLNSFSVIAVVIVVSMLAWRLRKYYLEG